MQQQQHQHQHQQQQQQQQSLQPSSQSRQEQQARQEQPGSAPAAAQPSPSTPSPSPSPVYELVVPDVSSDPRNVLPDVAAKVAEAERQGKGRKLISYSLFGAQPKYTQGAIENAMLVQRDWPGWTFRAYVGEGVPQHVLDGIRLFGGEVVFVTNTTLQSRDCSTFWRFFALEDRTATRVLVRDTDSRLTQRDHAAVTEWMNSTHSFHTTHDHPNHVWAVVGGSWGTVNGLIHPRLLDKWRTTQEGKTGCVWGYDQDWLRDEVWPLVAPYALQHASYHCGKFNASEVRGWPTRRQTPWDRMGNVYTDDNKWLGIKAEWYCPKECRRQPDWTSC